MGDLTVSAAVTQCYRDMGARHRARAHAIQIIRVEPVEASKTPDLLSSRCTTPKSSSLCHLVSRSPRDPFSRPRDPTRISFRFLLLVKKNKTPIMWYTKFSSKEMVFKKSAFSTLCDIGFDNLN